jgi:GxxExxY protein
MQNQELPYLELTRQILGCCFDVINELGVGFLESVYKNSLSFALEQKGLKSSTEVPYDVYFRQKKVGHYIADLIIEKAVVLEVKSCKNLLPEHEAQLINYLKASGLPVGLLVNFGKKSLEYKRSHHPSVFIVSEGDPAARQGDPAYPVLSVSNPFNL